jgi:hypothetical protein
MKLLSQEEVLITKLLDFYSDVKNMSTFVDIVEQGTVISLRLLDWFSTNYSKFNKVYIKTTDVHSDYKNKLDGYRKKAFDPFCRKKRIYVYCNTDNIRKPQGEKLQLEYHHIDNYEEYLSKSEGIVTTIGQLNFFMWCIDKGIINYIIDNIKKIETSMSESYNRKPTGTDGKRKKITPTTHKTVMKFTISF